MKVARIRLFPHGLRRPTASPDGLSPFEVYGFGLMVLLVAVPGLAALKLLVLAVGVVLAIVRNPIAPLGLFVGLSAAVSLAVAYAVGVIHDVPPQDRLNHLVRVFSFYAVFVCAHWIRDAISTPAKLDRLCLWIAVLMAGVKIGIWVAVALLGYSLEDAMGFFGFETVTLTIAFNIFRLQFPSDFVCLFLLAAYCGRRSTWLDMLFVVSASIVIFLSFSRFYFFCFVAGLIVRSVWLKRWDTIAIFGALVLVGALAVFGNELVERFVGDGAALSDETRSEQIQALSADIDLHPLLGRGIGAAVPNFSRSETLPFSYEVQWYAVVMQFGWVGTAVLVANVFAILLAGVRRSRVAMCVAVLVFLWIFAGFTNPLITSIGSAVGLAITRQRARFG